MTLEEYRGALDRAAPAPGLKDRILAAQETAPARPAPRRGKTGRRRNSATKSTTARAALSACPGRA